MIINYCLTDECGQYSMDISFKDEGIDSIGFEVVYDSSLEKATLFMDGEEDEKDMTEYIDQIKSYIQNNHLTNE